MGGGYIPSHDEDSCLKENFFLLSPDSPTFLRDDVSMKVEDGKVNGGSSVDFQVPGEESSHPSSLGFEVNERRRHSINRKILQSYDNLRIHCKNLKEAKEKILRYSPGAWTEKVGGLKLNDHEVPKTTCLILVGPKASGKSSLINRISKVFEDDKFTPDRAQVSYNSPTGDGTCFLQEFMIPRDSTSFCLYDTRSLSHNSEENDKMLSHWMTKGVRHGEFVVRNTDDQNLRKSLKGKARHDDDSFSTMRKVNFVIYVVNGLSVLKAMESTCALETQYIERIASTFNSPYLSFKDDKPVLVVTHGDLLSLSDRARVRAHLGEVLGIPPTKQIFDISECDDSVTDFTITQMLRYTLEHADRNYPLKSRVIEKVYKTTLPSLNMILLNLLLGVAILLAKDMFIGTFHSPHACSEKPYASHQEKQEVPAHYAEPEVPSHNAAKPEVPKHQEKPKISSHQEKQVPSHYAEPEVPLHDAAKPEVPKHQAKSKIASHHAKQKVLSHHTKPKVHIIEPKIVWHKIRHIW